MLMMDLDKHNKYTKDEWSIPEVLMNGGLEISAMKIRRI